MDTYPPDPNDTIVQNLSKNVLNLGNKVRALVEENKRLKDENERLAFIVGTNAIDREHGMCCDSSSEVERLKQEIKMLEGRVRYWKIEAECDHGRWLRTLEDLEHLRNLK